MIASLVLLQMDPCLDFTASKLSCKIARVLDNVAVCAVLFWAAIIQFEDIVKLHRATQLICTTLSNDLIIMLENFAQCSVRGKAIALSHEFIAAQGIKSAADGHVRRKKHGKCLLCR